MKPCPPALAAAAALLFLASGSLPAAAGGVHGGALPPCRPTPATGGGDYPGEASIATSNDLTRPAGKSFVASGQRVWITGRVYDSACVPLKDARVEIWQADAQGGTALPHREEFANPYPLFAATGSTATDNEGVYGFVTVFPGAYAVPSRGGKAMRAPHINFRITHPKLKRPFVTEMFFERDSHNPGDPAYKRYPPADRELLTAAVRPRDPGDPGRGLDVFFDLMVPARDPLRSY